MREEQLGTNPDVYRKVGSELGVPVYTTLPFFVSEKRLWFYDTMHMSRLGHRVLRKISVSSSQEYVAGQSLRQQARDNGFAKAHSRNKMASALHKDHIPPVSCHAWMI